MSCWILFVNGQRDLSVARRKQRNSCKVGHYKFENGGVERILYCTWTVFKATRNAHMIHIVNLIRLKMVYTS